MKWSRSELLHSQDTNIEFSEQISFKPDVFEKLDRLRGLRDVTVKGVGRYDSHMQRYHVDLVITGEMVVPCSITLEDVVVPFHTKSSETFIFGKDEDGFAHEVKGEVIDLSPTVFQLILMDIPWKVVKPGIDSYPKGKGWEVIKEEDLRSEKKNQTDPRLAKLKDFKPTDD